MSFTKSMQDYIADNQCLSCDAGQVELRIGIEVMETIKCPDCSGFGWLPANLSKEQHDNHEALNRALQDVQL